MNIECQTTEIKSRKGSCSTISSSNQSFHENEPNSSSHNFKHKKVRKAKKLRKHSSLTEEKSDLYFEDEYKSLVKENKKRIFMMVREIYELFHLHIDTYLVCLKIANMLKFDGESFLCFQIAGSICLLASKLHESHKISFAHISAWSGTNLSKENFEETEAAILYGLNFNVPSINPVWACSDVLEEINRIESLNV